MRKFIVSKNGADEHPDVSWKNGLQAFRQARFRRSADEATKGTQAEATAHVENTVGSKAAVRAVTKVKLEKKVVIETKSEAEAVANDPRDNEGCIELRVPGFLPPIDGKIKWFVKEGDAVISGSAVAELETSLYTHGVKAFQSGYLAKIVCESEFTPYGLLGIMVVDGNKLAAFNQA
jgi:biotin carboxyl carrier protein